jgi:DNA-binding IclR family transcriptional regulator
VAHADRPGRATGDPLQSVTRALQILGARADAPGGLRLGQIATRTGLRPSTVHRLLGTSSTRGGAALTDASRELHARLTLVTMGRAAARTEPSAS